MSKKTTQPRKPRAKKLSLILAGNRIICGKCKYQVYQHIHGMYVYCTNPECTEFQVKYEMPTVKVTVKG
jgi:hypothetical protein